MSYLKFKAGPKAYQLLQERGLRAEDIRVIPAAAGGPKWISLFELDKYIFGKFLADHNQPIDLIGASAGAWRMACGSQNNPLEALDQFYAAYVNQRYEEIPSPAEVQEKCRHIVSETLGKNGIDEILNNTLKRLHIITCRSKFGNPKDKIKRKYYEIVLANTLGRKHLNRYFQRCIFSNSQNTIVKLEEDIIDTNFQTVSREDLPQAMLASGAIPGVIAPVTNIASVPGIHWDGGVTDYHLDLPYDMEDGLILYPHFEGRILAGWLDQYVPFRKARKENLDQMLLLYPSKDFIKTLPQQRIPERKDFNRFFKRDDERIDNWNQAAKQCKVLAEELEDVVNNGIDMNTVEKF